MKTLTETKIDELVKAAESDGEMSVLAIALALRGAKHNKKEYYLAKKVQEYVKDVLIPMAKEDKEKEKTSKN